MVKLGTNEVVLNGCPSLESSHHTDPSPWISTAKNWFLYDRGLCHERVTYYLFVIKIDITKIGNDWTSCSCYCLY